MFILIFLVYFVSLIVKFIEPKTGSFKNRAIVCHSIWESNSEENQRFGEMIGNHFHKIDSWCTLYIRRKNIGAPQNEKYFLVHF